MSHIAEVYAKDLGVKIGQPVISDHFVPGLPEKYISFQASNKMTSKNYLYWDIVLGLLQDHLFTQNIQVVQVGGKDDPQVGGVSVDHRGTSYRQMNYIIKNAQAHLGVDSLPMHVASAYDRPMVALFGNLYVTNANPLWNKTNKAICLEPDFSEEKPSFGTNCTRINEIKPEVVAQSMLNILGIDEKIKFKTVRIGSKYHQQTVEIEPNFFAPSEQLKGKAINLRGDLCPDINTIVQWTRMCITNLYISEPFDLNALPHMTNLKQVIFKHNAGQNVDLNDFFKILKRKKINVAIETTDTDNISDLRLKYFDYPVVETVAAGDEVKASKYLSKKKFISGGQIFYSKFAAKKLDKSDNFSYDECSSKELENLYLYDEEE